MLDQDELAFVDTADQYDSHLTVCQITGTQ
jgi:hypothetical protein